MKNIEREPILNNEEKEVLDSNNQVETTEVGGRTYEIGKLRHFAEKIPVQEVLLDDVRDAVGEGHTYWVDRNGESLAPHQLIQNWTEAQQNDAWKDHVDSIRRANPDDPIWVTKDGHVFDGVHRLTRAVIDGRSTVKVKVFKELPATALRK